MVHASYPDTPNVSPWIAAMTPPGPPRPLEADTQADVVIVGAGIAGVATAFFTLRATDQRVVLLERDRVARGATGRNASQLTTYFERPLVSIAEEFGTLAAAQAQAVFKGAQDLVELMAQEAGATVRIERFMGRMGMYSLAQVMTHLRCQAVREAGGVPPEIIEISSEAPYLGSIPDDLASFYEVVPQARIRELLELDDDRYTAVLSEPGGCAIAGLLVEQVLAYLEERYADRFSYHDCTQVDVVEVADGEMDDGVIVHAGGHAVRARHAVLCTNGYVLHRVLDTAGDPIELHPDQRIVGRIGYMAAFAEDELRVPASFSYIRNLEIGGSTPYVYVTRRTYDLPGGRVATLTCMGGPEYPMDDGAWREEAPYPGAMLDLMDREIRPFAQPARPAGQPYDFAWHGLMGYMDGGIRVIGAHPDHPALLYNLGCNGVGFLPSIAGGDRIARILAGERLGPSIFEPRPSPRGAA
jgi:glycine/D-amino acid oxidase-like deaminating enzyme